MRDILQDLPLINSYEDVLDRGISKGTTNWQLYGSRKPHNQAYQLTAQYEVWWEDGEREIEEIDLSNPKKNFILDLLPVISARNTNIVKFPFKAKALALSKNKKSSNIKKSRKTYKKKYLKQNIAHQFSSISNQNDLDAILKDILEDSADNNKYDLKEAHDYTMILSEQFYDPYEKWIDVGWTLFCIDYCLFPTWVAFSAKSDKFDFNNVEEMFDQWNDMEDRGKTLGSLIYWAKEENPHEFKKAKENTISYYIDRTLEGCAEYDIAKVLYKMEGENFKCVSFNCRKIWYAYQNGRWIEINDGADVRQKLSEQLNSEYLKRQHALMNRITAIANADGSEALQQRAARMADIALKLKKTNWKNNIMREASELFRDKHFLDRLDSNPYLLCFRNGVIDFEHDGIFRKGKPSDYLSLCTNIDYIPFDENNQKHQTVKKEVETFFRQLFPNPALYKYMWEHLSSVLLGKNLNQTFNMYTGSGRNGKSKLVELMGTMLGDYKGTVPISLVTQKRGHIGGVSPEIAALKGIRYAVMQEPSKGMALNEGVMKELTGGDPIQGRKLFRDVITFIPQFTLVVCTNHLFDINTDDDGTWRRIRVCDYISKFVPKPSANPDNHQFLVDPNIDLKFTHWKEITMSLLVQLAIKTGGKVADCDIVMASSQKYKSQQDYFTAFFEDRIIKCAGSQCGCNTQNPKSKCRMKQRDVLEVFKDWYLELYGGKIPKGKDLYNFLEKKIGKPTRGRGYMGYLLMDPNIDEEDDD
ncbi:MAG: phage/plasmid primase, P4 family, partial [Candidatus Neomarinimicrobiota bacterium]